MEILYLFDTIADRKRMHDRCGRYAYTYTYIYMFDDSAKVGYYFDTVAFSFVLIPLVGWKQMEPIDACRVISPEQSIENKKTYIF